MNNKRSKKFNSFEGIVFSTNPDYEIETPFDNEPQTVEAGLQEAVKRAIATNAAMSFIS